MKLWLKQLILFLLAIATSIDGAIRLPLRAQGIFSLTLGICMLLNGLVGIGVVFRPFKWVRAFFQPRPASIHSLLVRPILRVVLDWARRLRLDQPCIDNVRRLVAVRAGLVLAAARDRLPQLPSCMGIFLRPRQALDGGTPRGGLIQQKTILDDFLSSQPSNIVRALLIFHWLCVHQCPALGLVAAAALIANAFAGQLAIAAAAARALAVAALDAAAPTVGARGKIALLCSFIVVEVFLVRFQFVVEEDLLRAEKARRPGHFTGSGRRIAARKA